MRIRVALTDGAGVERENDEFDVPANADDPDEIVNLCASDIIQSWILSAGDTITIIEVKP